MNLNEKRRIFNFFLLVIPTGVIFFIGFLLTMQWKYASDELAQKWNDHLSFFIPIFLLWLVLYYGFGLLNLWTFTQFCKRFSSLCLVTVVNFILAVLAFYLQPELLLTPRRFLLVLTLLIFLGSLMWQFLIRKISPLLVRHRILLLDLETESIEIKKELQKNDRLSGIQFTTITSLELQQKPESFFKTWEGCILVLPQSSTLSQPVLEILSNIHSYGISFLKFDEFYEDLFRRIDTSHLSKLWFLENIQRTRKGFYPTIKRLIDFCFGLMIALVLVITFPVVAILIKLTSRGPIFFKQPRLSTNGKSILIYK
ncbi:MAG: sugar transferase, partial [Patescibacteria group bacterium]